MRIGRRAFASLLSVNVSSRHVLACGVIFAIAQVAACSSQISVGHGQADSGGTGGRIVILDEPAGGGSGSALSNGGNGASLEAAGAGGQAGAPGPSCTGSLEAVNQALGPECPASLCEAAAWVAASCSLVPGVLAATGEICSGVQATFKAFSLELGDGATKTCVYAANKSFPAPIGQSIGAISADGDLVGVTVADVRDRFCGDTESTISAGQLQPANCTKNLTWSCTRPADSGDAGASNEPAPEEAVQACFNNQSGTCQTCCPATPPDCSDKPNGYPGYRCTVSHGSWCSCSCSRGEWVCGC